MSFLSLKGEQRDNQMEFERYCLDTSSAMRISMLERSEAIWDRIVELSMQGQLWTVKYVLVEAKRIDQRSLWETPKDSEGRNRPRYGCRRHAVGRIDHPSLPEDVQAVVQTRCG